MSQSGNKSSNILLKWEIQKERWRCLLPGIDSNAFSTMSLTPVSTSLATVVQSWACSRHLHLPCSSDRFCSCPRVPLLPSPPEQVTLELGITFVAPLCLCCTKRPWGICHCCGYKHHKLHQKTIKYNSYRLLYENLDFHP